MVNLSLILLDGMILTSVFSVLVIGTILWRPRMWLHDFPPDIQALMPPKTNAEKRLTRIFSIPFLTIFFGGLGLTASRYGLQNGFVWTALHVYLVWQVVNVIDLLIIDWLGMHAVDPQNPPFSGTAGAKGYRDYRFHFIGFLKGCIMGLVFAPVIVGAVHFITG